MASPNRISLLQRLRGVYQLWVGGEPLPERGALEIVGATAEDDPVNGRTKLTFTAGAVTFAAVKAALALANSTVGLNGQKIINLGAPTASGDAVTKAYVDAIVTFARVSAALELATGPVGFNSQKITDLADPTAATDAVNLQTLEAQLAALTNERHRVFRPGKADTTETHIHLFTVTKDGEGWTLYADTVLLHPDQPMGASDGYWTAVLVRTRGGATDDIGTPVALNNGSTWDPRALTPKALDFDTQTVSEDDVWYLKITHGAGTVTPLVGVTAAWRPLSPPP